MRKLYLVRHGRPEFPDGESCCLGSTDLPLGTLGRMQAYLAAELLREKGIGTVFSSPLSRAVQTAEYLCPEPRLKAGLEEVFAGDWDGLSFAEIRRRWPELYILRGHDRSIMPPGSESMESANRRFSAAVTDCLAESRTAPALVTHRSVSLGWLKNVCGIQEPELENAFGCGSVMALELDGEGRAQSAAICERVELNPERAEMLLRIHGTPDNVRAHCAAVAELGAELCRRLSLNAETAYCAGLLHDIARTGKDHARTGAQLMERLGYPLYADIIGRHHELGFAGQIDEATVVYIADKLLLGSERVSLETRFSRSAGSCGTPEAAAAHLRRFEEAQKVKARINEIYGKELIP